MVKLPVFLPAADRATFKTTKVIYNCLLREDHEATDAMPVRSTFSEDWPEDIQERVLGRWSEYGYTS